jgi:hypothetical protein
MARLVKRGLQKLRRKYSKQIENNLAIPEHIARMVEREF